MNYAQQPDSPCSPGQSFREDGFGGDFGSLPHDQSQPDNSDNLFDFEE